MARRTKRTVGSSKFAGVPLEVIKTRKYASLSAWAVKLLLEFAAQYNGPGTNNGDLQAAPKVMMRQGWRSSGTLHAATKELERAGFIVRTRQGGRNQCNLYALTWNPIDECIDRKTGQPKHDVKPTIVAPGNWRDDADVSRAA